MIVYGGASMDQAVENSQGECGFVIDSFSCDEQAAVTPSPNRIGSPRPPGHRVPDTDLIGQALE